MTISMFITHKMPTDTPLSRDLGALISMYAGSGMEIKHAGDFPKGEDWKDRIKDEIERADILLFLFTSPDEDWEFCLWEAGYFEGTMKLSGKPKLLVTLCRDASQINSALERFNAVVANSENVFGFLSDIYLKDPWKLHPALAQDTLKKTATEIADLFTGARRIVANYDVVPGVILEIDRNEANMTSLARRKLPGTTIILGSGDWQPLFGKAGHTGGWPWIQLRKEWPYASVYEYLLARMVDDAMRSQDLHGILVRIQDSIKVYRLTLRRFEELAGGKLRFFVTASPLDIPFYFTSNPELEQNVVLYHLVNLSWIFRRRFVDGLYRRLREIRAKLTRDPAEIARLLDDIVYELYDIDAQSIIRGVDNPLTAADALRGSDEDLTSLFEGMKNWYVWRDEIVAQIDSGKPDLDAISETVFKMAEVNFGLFKAAASAYGNTAEGLPLPRK
jgi:hypothetical protein